MTPDSYKSKATKYADKLMSELLQEIEDPEATSHPDTPRTDEVLINRPSHLQEVALANLAQDLERELAASLRNQAKAFRELAEARALLIEARSVNKTNTNS